MNLMRDSMKKMRRKLVLMAMLLVACGAALSLSQSKAHMAAFVLDEKSTPSVFDNPSLASRYQQSITAENLASRLYFLASDFFEGRETATRGAKLAAHYLASQYRKIGLEPKGTAKTGNQLDPAAYLQPFKVYKRAPKTSRLEVLTGGKKVVTSEFSQTTQDELAYFAFGSLTNASGGVVFAGYGIKDDELRYNDFAQLAQQGIRVDGKWLIILADEPLKAAETSLLKTADGQPSKWTTLVLNKRRAIWDAGRPAGVLIVSDAGPRGLDVSFKDAARRAALAQSGVGALSLYQATESSFPPTYMISSKMADQILSVSGQTIKGLKQEIDRSLKPSVFEMKNVEVKTSVEIHNAFETENVLAFIEGSDPKLKEEVVVITSHYDHLGINPQARGDQIYNGAADDASGTVASLEMAEAFMKAKRDGFGPRRSILFINTSGEEKGMLGSSYYTDMQPIVPLEKIVTNINMDGIGGFDLKQANGSRNYIYILGSKQLSEELIEINRRVNDLAGIKLELDYTKTNFGSDQMSFEKYFVPFIYYSTGLTEHYHQPSDEAHTIDYQHMARVAQLSFSNAWQIANQEKPPAGIDRSRLVMSGYACPPCPFLCDDLSFESTGECPVCGMPLMRQLKMKS
jgi:hypothetical protein